MDPPVCIGQRLFHADSVYTGKLFEWNFNRLLAHQLIHLVELDSNPSIKAIHHPLPSKVTPEQ